MRIAKNTISQQYKLLNRQLFLWLTCVQYNNTYCRIVKYCTMQIWSGQISGINIEFKFFEEGNYAVFSDWNGWPR